MKTIAIIPAGGAGKRLKSHIAKQYLMLDHLPVMVHALKVFQDSPEIDEIILALPPEDLVHIRQELAEKYGLTKVTHAVAGGNERQDSVKNCLDIISDECGMVLIHDAVRPFVTEELIVNIVAAAKETGAAIVGVKAKDTIKEVNTGHVIGSTIPRSNLWLAQTPQAFDFKLLKEAYSLARKENYYGTDDASLVERLGREVKVVEGSSENIKITTNDDMLMADAIIKKRNKGGLRSGFGYDSHRFVTNRKLIMGGVEIPFDKGLQGHSDADALLHAVCDALLGAAGAGDIGRHFPDTDPKYKDISSMILLEQVCKLIKKKGYRISNIDVTVIMEMPRLAPYAEQMVSNIVGVLDIARENVNIKAKTNEGMGFVGRNEGAAVFATAMLTERKKDGFNAQS
jgi:2-C-methyl-D-erythritol 4-phosphate cytidylyltransferase/2-C-methyl-D-erythritol 2,4-cyclodiphosphate synthase